MADIEAVRLQKDERIITMTEAAHIHATLGEEVCANNHTYGE